MGEGRSLSRRVLLTKEGRRRTIWRLVVYGALLLASVLLSGWW